MNLKKYLFKYYLFQIYIYKVNKLTFLPLITVTRIFQMGDTL